MSFVVTMKPTSEPLNRWISKCEYFGMFFIKIEIMVKVIAHTKITDIAKCVIFQWKYEENETQTDTNKIKNSKNAYNYFRLFSKNATM